MKAKNQQKKILQQDLENKIRKIKKAVDQKLQWNRSPTCRID